MGKRKRKKKSLSSWSNQKQFKFRSTCMSDPATCMEAKRLVRKAVVILKDEANDTLPATPLWVLDFEKIYMWNCNNTPGVLFRMLLKGKLNIQLHYIQHSTTDWKLKEVHYLLIHELNYNYKSLMKIATQVYHLLSHLDCLQLNSWHYTESLYLINVKGKQRYKWSLWKYMQRSLDSTTKKIVLWSKNIKGSISTN